MDKTITSILAGLGGMLGWGTSDFLANESTDRIGTTRTFFWSQIVGTLLISVALLLTQPVFDIPASLFPLILLTGFGYAFGYLFYYKAFEVGNVSLASVVINLNAVVTMIIVYLLFGERLTGFQIPAIVLVFLGVLLVSVNFGELVKPKGRLLFIGVKETLISAFLFGAFTWAVTDYLVKKADWMWIAFGTKVTALILVFLFCVLRKTKLKVPQQTVKSSWWLIGLVGALDALAVLSVNFGFSVGNSILVAPIANSVAIVTVTLAIIFLKEKITKIQAIGMVLAIGGILLTGL